MAGAGTRTPESAGVATTEASVPKEEGRLTVEGNHGPSVEGSSGKTTASVEAKPSPEVQQPAQRAREAANDETANPQYKVDQPMFASGGAASATRRRYIEANVEESRAGNEKASKFAEHVDAERRILNGAPTLEISRAEYPNHVQMLENARAKGHSLSDLERGPSTRAADRNRYQAQKQIRKMQGPPPTGFDYDEFPYASTAQGGAGAHVEAVLSGENQAAGRLLGRFYGQKGIKPGAKFNIKVVK